MFLLPAPSQGHLSTLALQEALEEVVHGPLATAWLMCTTVLSLSSSLPSLPPLSLFSPPPQQGYNAELVRCIEDLREKREEVNRSILRDEEEKAKIQRELQKFTERLSKLNEDLVRRRSRTCPRANSTAFSSSSHAHLTSLPILSTPAPLPPSTLLLLLLCRPARCRLAWSLTRPSRRQRQPT